MANVTAPGADGAAAGDEDCGEDGGGDGLDGLPLTGGEDGGDAGGEAGGDAGGADVDGLPPLPMVFPVWAWAWQATRPTIAHAITPRRIPRMFPAPLPLTGYFG